LNKVKSLHIRKNKPLSLEEKERKLIALMGLAFNSTLYKQEFSHILSRFNLNREDIVQAFLDYNLDVYSHNNEIYQSQANRVVLHIHNLIKGSWHIERQEAVCKLVEKAAPSKVIDLGFGVPSRYVRELLVSFPFHLTLCDNTWSAIIFAEELLNIWNPNWAERINFLCADMENVEQCVGNYDLYISLHSIEHVRNPTKCLGEYVKLSMPNALFLIEIPIGPITPEHYLSWDNVAQGREWIDSVGLEVIDQHLTHVNSDIDLFAEPHNFEYSGYLVLCKKKGYK
jgi:SAM-dependent methyltransferase